MKFTATAVASLTLLSSAVASDDGPQTAHLLFRDAAGQPSFNLSVVADGQAQDTGNAQTKISLIDAPDYAAAYLCDLTFAVPDGASQPDHHFQISDDRSTGQIAIDPPTVVKSITCEGHCVATPYGVCNSADGSAPKLCCNGYCAADRCRSYDSV